MDLQNDMDKGLESPLTALWAATLFVWVWDFRESSWRLYGYRFGAPGLGVNEAVGEAAAIMLL